MDFSAIKNWIPATLVIFVHQARAQSGSTVIVSRMLKMVKLKMLKSNANISTPVPC